MADNRHPYPVARLFHLGRPARKPDRNGGFNPGAGQAPKGRERATGLMAMPVVSFASFPTNRPRPLALLLRPGGAFCLARWERGTGSCFTSFVGSLCAQGEHVLRRPKGS